MIYTLVINSIAVFIAAWLLEGVRIKNFFTAILVAIALAIVNALVKPVILFLTLPLTLLTLGLFALVINAFMIMLVDSVIKDFRVKSFWWAAIFALLLSLITSFLYWLF